MCCPCKVELEELVKCLLPWIYFGLLRICRDLGVCSALLKVDEHWGREEGVFNNIWDYIHSTYLTQRRFISLITYLHCAMPEPIVFYIHPCDLINRLLDPIVVLFCSHDQISAHTQHHIHYFILNSETFPFFFLPSGFVVTWSHTHILNIENESLTSTTIHIPECTSLQSLHLTFARTLIARESSITAAIAILSASWSSNQSSKHRSGSTILAWASSQQSHLFAAAKHHRSSSLILAWTPSQ